MNGFGLIFVGILLVAIGIGYGLRRREVGKKAAAIDFRNGILLIGVSVILCTALFRLFPGSSENHVFFLTLIVAYWVYFISWLRRRGQAGSVLLDLGGSKRHKTSIILGIMGMLLGTFWLVLVIVRRFLEPGSEVEISFVYQGPFWLSIGITSFLVGLSHFELREGGVFYLDIAKKWERIESYEWEGENGLTLILKFRQRLPFFRTRSMPIPAHHKNKVDNLLAQYVKGDRNSI